jgi:dethiobiotin synthetase
MTTLLRLGSTLACSRPRTHPVVLRAAPSCTFTSSAASPSSAVVEDKTSSTPKDTHDDETASSSTNCKYWSVNPDSGRAQRPIFVAATKQHVGKTTVSLALMSGLKKIFPKVGFIKPVGQQHVQVQDSTPNQTLRVDKDVVLMREHFRLDHVDYRHMSPVIIPSGYTKRFVDGEIDFQQQLKQVQDAMQHQVDRSDICLIEGTGHCAVGSIVGLNNAKVASILGADMVLMYVQEVVCT